LTESRPLFAAQAARLVTVLTGAARRFPGNEAGFRFEAERALDELVGEHGIELHKRPELTLATGRADAVFNRLIVEWEPPGALAAHERHPPNKHAVDQLRAYVDGLAARERREIERLMGVACDGRFMIFARYRAGRWIVDEPVPVDERSAEQLLESIVAAQSARALTAENLLRDFGPQTALTQRLSRALLGLLETSLGHHPDGLTARRYRQWETLFAVATGVVGEGPDLARPARAALAGVFGIDERQLHPGRALFSLQTYFSIVTKLIALLALTPYVSGVDLRLDEMASAGDEDLWEDLDELQRGEHFRKAGLPNVIEPDVFGWYTDWDESVRNGVREVLSVLADYDPSTLHVSPEDARDLLKDLYQGLLPRPVRHAPGSTSRRTGWPSTSFSRSSTKVSRSSACSTRPAAPARSSCSRSLDSRRRSVAAGLRKSRR